MNTNTNIKVLGSKFKTVTFFATKYVENLVHSLSHLLKTELGIETRRIIIGKQVTTHDVQVNESRPDELMFILIPHLLVTGVASLPPAGKYALYQLEQLNDKGIGNVQPPISFNALFCRLILQSLVTFDYTQVNLKHYPEACRHKLRVLTPPILPMSRTKSNKPKPKDIDVMFYGTANSRRNIILGLLKDELQSHGYNMTVVSALFGAELLDHIARSKVVLNVHYYANSIFESDRVHTALRFPDVRVVSERATEQDDSTDHLYASHPRVFLCDEIRDYNSCDPALKSVITGKLLAACLTALESFTQDQDQAEKKEEEAEESEHENDNQQINELSKNQILV
jgi:hypothetical protein